ncbi:MAG: dihydrodipicolinate synthase family protein [Promethearchaeota archaeon]
MAIEPIEGLVAAPYTPLRNDGTVNLDVVGEYCEMLARNGVVGVFLNGTSGEGVSLSTAERKALVERWVDVAPADLKVIVHIGHTSVVEAVELGRHAQDAGAWGIGSMAPLFFRPRAVGDLVDHCAKEAASAPDLPYYFYHIPALSLVDFPMLDYMKLAVERIPNFRGIKYTHNDLMDEDLCRRFGGDDHEILHGYDETLLAALVFGCKAAIGSSYNYAAPLYNDMIREFKAGHLEAAVSLQRKAIDMIHLMFQCLNFFAAARVLLTEAGIDIGRARSPLPRLGEKEEGRLRDSLASIGFSEFCCK